jgi:hypothetical protein
VQRGVDVPQPRGTRRCRGDGAHRVEIRPGHLVTGPGDERAVWLGDQELAERAELHDRGLDLGVRGRHDLAAVPEVELVAVVGRRVVASGDHDTGGGVQVTDGEGEQRRRLLRWQQMHWDTRTGQHSGRLAGKLVAAPPGVAPDDDAVLRSAGIAVAQPGRQGCGRCPDDRAVHPVRAGADHAAKSGGAELQASGKPVGDLGGGFGAGIVQ